MLQAVMFDWDGTVGDTLGLCIQAFRKTFEQYSGRAYSDAEITALFGPNEEGLIQAVMPDRYEEGMASYLHWYETLHAQCPEPFGGMRELIALLKERGVAVTLITGKGPGSCRISLERCGMTDCFQLVETGSPTGSRKSEAIRSVLERLKLSPAQAVYVGDAPSDVHDAQACGVEVLSAGWGSLADCEELERLNPGKVFRSVDALRSYLEEMV